ncbi:hypothetical protein KIN20_000397 [Parelaphostrongylus tenuis]|uniref:PIN domain-containing protein n=1 Tax=Parelaphostrongylus tenuis TaxID=148309 RepID=A0AAD5LUN9_PARTN|nr:hypothetical protein KIN20_000397 [Parelaphostrongylus tenuis]
MSDGGGQGCSSLTTSATTRTRKTRPDIQIYRPGMMRRGAEVTSRELTRNDSNLPSEALKAEKIQSRTSVGSYHSMEKLGESTNRRKSNDTESVHSYYDSGSTTPDAASVSGERQDGSNKSTSQGFSRSGRFSANRQVYNSNDFNNRTPARKRNVRDYNDRQNPQVSPVQKNRQFINDRVSNSGYSYISTQSLYDPQRSEGYLNYRSSFGRRQKSPPVGRAPSPVRFRRKSQQHTERSSMRAEGGRRNVGQRKRNDSINSTQSECLAPLPDRLPLDATSETQSVADDAISSASLSYMQLCQSFESLGSFDWSKEVESEYNAKHSEDGEEKPSERFENSYHYSSQKEDVEDEPHSSLMTRGILRIPPGLRHDRERTRTDSDRSSSIHGSIVEEECDSSDLSSGECTPTEESGDEKHWNYRKEKRSAMPARDKPQSSGFSRRILGQSDNKPRRLAGRVAPDRSNTGPYIGEAVSPLASRTSRGSLRVEARKPYRPPAMRVAAKVDGTGGDVRDSKRTTASSSQPQKMTDFPVYHEITNNEGPRMQKINDSITSLLLRVQKRDIKAAEKVVELSGELCEIYYKLLPRDISFTFTMNLEQHLWKQAFYKPIEVFKSVVNSPKDNTRAFRAVLLSLLNNGITFYARLLDLYEKELQVDLEKLILFSFDRDDAFWDVCYETNTDLSRRKVASKSYSRHLISLGDLKRYKTLIEGSEDYSDARAMYMRSAQLWPSSGHCYNQLAVIAYFSGHALDEIFYCVRSLSAGYPFEVARDRLYARLAAMKRKVDKYEPLLDHECGEVKEDAELAASADRPYELWLDNDDSDIEANTEDEHIFRSFLEQQPSKLHRRAISYLINTVGLLITKIGMESFPSVSERAIVQLAALVEQESSPVTAGQLIQVVALFIYAVHCNAIAGDEDVCSVQQQQAVRTLVSVFGTLLRPISLRLAHISTWIRNPLEVPYVISRILPAVCVLCEWFSCPLASAIYRTMPSVEPLSLSIIEIDTWHLLAAIANELIRWQDSGQLVKIQSSADANYSCILPELAFISSFSSVFPPFPRILHYTCPSTESLKTQIPLQIRLAQLLLAAEYLDGSELSCFFFCEKSGKFMRSEQLDGTSREQSKVVSVAQGEKSLDILPPASREELLERELKKHEQLLVVKPCYVVIDTNAFIDQLCAIQKILQCERFRVLIPTTVVEELIELQHSEQGSAGVEAVTEGARQAITWLREQTRLKKSSRLFTLTMRGRRLPVAVVRESAGDDGDLVNDDRILHSCLNFTQLEPAPDATFSNFKVPQGREIPIIYRNLVLLTDDRVLNMKAMSQHIPCRTVTRFMKWAKIR